MIRIEELSKEKIGSRIRAAREDQDIDQKKLAEEIGVSYSILNKIENGNREIRVDELVRIASALNVKIEYLLGMIDENINFVDDFIRLFDRLITSRDFYIDDPKVYSPEDLMYSVDRDFIVLSGDPALFGFIKKIAIICGQKTRLSPAEYEGRLNAARNRYKEIKEQVSKGTRSDSETYFLITGEQISEMADILVKSGKAISVLEAELKNTDDVSKRPQLRLRINKE